MLFSIKATVDRIEGGKAIMQIQEDLKIKLPEQELVWPSENLPPNISEGDIVSVGILKEADATANKEEMARNMLDSLLKKANKTDTNNAN